MWSLVRVVALAVVACVAVLLAGQVGWLLDTLDRLVGLGGLGPLPRGGVPGPAEVVAGLVAGVGLATVGPLRRVVGQVVTLLHELGHTVVSAALGARPAGIVLRHDASGHATARWRGRPGVGRRLSLAVTAFAGLPAPAVAAAAAAGLLTVAGPRAVLWTMVAASTVVAVLARSAWSLAVPVGLAGLAVAALSEVAEPWAAGVVVASVTALALRATTDALVRLRRAIPDGDDARAVQRHLGLPPRLVQGVQVLATGAGGVWAVRLLLAAVPEGIAGITGPW